MRRHDRRGLCRFRHLQEAHGLQSLGRRVHAAFAIELAPGNAVAFDAVRRIFRLHESDAVEVGLSQRHLRGSAL